MANIYVLVCVPVYCLLGVLLAKLITESADWQEDHPRMAAVFIITGPVSVPVAVALFMCAVVVTPLALAVMALGNAARTLISSSTRADA